LVFRAQQNLALFGSDKSINDRSWMHALSPFPRERLFVSLKRLFVPQEKKKRNCAGCKKLPASMKEKGHIGLKSCESPPPGKKKN